MNEQSENTMNEQDDMRAFIALCLEDCSEEDLRFALQRAAENIWPNTFVSAIHQMVEQDVDAVEIVRRILEDAARGRSMRD